ncbi:hypothetical protein ACHAQA_005258 [Verticillium albo-atrum]
MASSSYAPAVLAVVLVTSLIWLLRYSQAFSAHSYPLPPGPPGKLFVGNLGQVNIDSPEKDYLRWGQAYDSDVIHTEVLGQHLICLNSRQAAEDLLDRRGGNYCDRPRFTLFEIMGWGLTLTFLRWGPRFNLHRRLFQTTFSRTNVRKFQPIQQHEARKAVHNLLQDPAEWKDITLLMATSIIFRIAFGQEVVDKNSPYCAMSQAANYATTAGGTPGSTLVDLFPPARYLPDWLNLSEPLRHARRSRETIRTIHETPWAASLKEIDAGTAAPSFMKTHLEKYRAVKESGATQELTIPDIKGAAGAIFIAGGNTTWSTLQACVLFLTKHPETQRRIQKELDDAVGPDRLPSFEDRPSLPYLDRFISESLRCLPLNPLVIPHKSLEEDVYNDMRIPKGSIVFANASAMASDPSVYDSPDVFDPDRYLRGEPEPPGNFGFGRRKCPGNFLALASVQIFLATLMAAFHIEKAVGADGEPLEPRVGITIGLGGDVCRKHAASCVTKGTNRGRASHEVQTIKRGQKPRACDACAHSKLACDLAQPCGRCVSRQATCSYNKVHRDPSNASGMDPLRIRKPYARDARARLSIPFLLSMTDPKAEHMFKSFFHEPMREAEIGGSEFDPEREFFPWNITDILFMDMDEEPDLYDLFDQVPDIDNASPALDARLAFIVAELGAVHARLSAMDASYSGSFSLPSAKQVFTSRNAKLFVSTFFRYTQPDFPVAHVPSFSYEESSLELLLALMLMGSMRAVPRDDTLSAHTFFRVGEEYIFQRLREVVALEPRQERPSKRVLEVLIAALNIHSLRALVNDKDVRRRTRTEHLPLIVSTIRSLGLLQMKHDLMAEDTTWDEFVRVETCVRLAAWTALIDWSQCGTFNAPPLIASAELTGDFPCSDELWTAEDAAEFRLVALREAVLPRPSTSLSHCLAVLMQDSWLGASHFPLMPVSLMDLYFLIGALSACIVSARLMSTLSASAPVILSAIRRWQELWESETTRLGPEKVRASGLFRHSGGVAWLVRRAVEVSLGTGKQCAYTNGVDHDSLKELHEFLQMCRDT